jgi:hypothetical protein
MKRKPQAIIYTILADDKPVAALEASGTEARELLKERWFLQELSCQEVWQESEEGCPKESVQKGGKEGCSKERCQKDC